MKPKSPASSVDHLDVFQGLVEGLDDAFTVKDTSNRYILVNTAAARFIGISLREILGKTDIELFPEEKARQMAERDRLAMTRGMPVSFEDRAHVGGVDREFSTIVGPWYDQHGTLLGVFSMTREITDQKRMEKWLVENEKRFRAMIEHSADCIALLDASAEVLYASPSTTRVLGYPLGDYVGRNAMSLVHPDDIERVRQHFSELVRQPGHIMTQEFRHRHLDGSWKWMESTGTNLLREPGIRAIVTNFRDISERKRAEETRLLLASIVESSNDGIISQTLDGTILTWNTAAERIFGYSATEAIGRHISITAPPDRREEFETLLGRLREGLYLQGYDAEGIRKDGEHIQVSLTMSPIRDSAGRIIGVSAIARDVTLPKQLAEQSHRSQKMEAIGRFAGAVTHEFNNVFTIILGYCDLLRGPRYPVANLSRDLERVQRTVERGAHLTKQLLGLASKQKTHPVVLDLNKELVKIETMLPALIHENVKLVLYLTREPVMIKADANLIDQLVVNLALNALEAMPERGHLTIETSNVQFADQHVTRSGVVPAGSYVRLTVKDTGRGMTPDIISHLYEPFFSTKPREKHSGLGLAVVYSIVYQSGGYIDAYSERGRGTAFDIYLPKVEVIPQPERAVVRKANAGTETILVLEDDRVLRGIVVEHLTGLGYFILEAHDCIDAIDLCRQHSSKVDLLLTDVAMPDMNGPALAETIREIAPGIKVLFMSGYPQEHVQRKEGGSSQMNFLAKPLSASQLAAKVRMVLDSE
jgi:PAS domain S-box-containing protein